MELKDSLKSLGLEEKEIDIYLGLLELGEASVSEISTKSGVKRPTTYVILDSLEKKGLVTKKIRRNKTLFFPQNPRKLISEAELNLKQLQETVPQLEAMLKRKSRKPKVFIYEGKELLDRANDESFARKGEVIYMGTLKLSKEVFPRTYRKTDYAVSDNFRIRELIDDNEETQAYAQKVSGQFRQVRFMPKKLMPFETDIAVFGNMTLITSVKREYFTIAIESKEIAITFRNIFEVIWQIAI